MKFFSKCLILLFLLNFAPVWGEEGANFEPFTPAEKALYKFKLDKMFYPDEAAFKAEMEKARQTADTLTDMKGKVLSSSKELLQTMELQRELRDREDMLSGYSHFRKAMNADDRFAEEEFQKVDAGIQSKLSFIKVELKALTAPVLEKFTKEEPKLKKYHYILNDYVRMAPHTLSEDKESILSALAPDLANWQELAFQKAFDRHVFPKIKVGDKELDVYIDFDGLMKNPDPAIREKTFRDYYAFFKENADLTAFALRQLQKTLNSLAQLRGFPTYYEESLFERYLTRTQVDALYKQIEEGLPVYHAYQQFRMDKLKADYGLKDLNIWDYDIPPKNVKLSRFTIDQSREILANALKVLGASYSLELGKLLDPQNGRLDLVPGPKREQGAFCDSYFGFFSNNFQGFMDDVSTMGHEAGHAINYQLVKNDLGSSMFGEGPNYMTESYAMFNENLMRDYLSGSMKDPAELANLRWDIVSEMVYLWELARRAKFEMICYDRMAKDQIKDEKDINQICTEVGTQYDLFFKKHPDMLAYHWMRKHHYWSVPTYYVNYIFAHILALKYFQLYKADPVGFPPKYVAMVAAGFDRPATKLLKDFLNIDFEDPSMLKGVFDMISKNIDELKASMK